MTTIIAQINWKISVYHLCIEPFGDLIATFHKLKRTKRTHTYRHRSDVLCRLWRPRNWIFNYVYMAHRNQICVYETETNMFSAFVEIVINMRLWIADIIFHRTESSLWDAITSTPCRRPRKKILPKHLLNIQLSILSMELFFFGEKF